MERYFYFDRTKSIEELESNIWDKPTFESSLILAVHELRKKALDELTLSDVRILISQKIGLRFVMALAIEALEENILAKGDFYSGDLLNVVSEVENEFWSENSNLKDDFEKILICAIDNLISKLELFKLNTCESKN